MHSRQNVVDELLSAGKSEFRVGRRIAPERGRCRLSGRHEMAGQLSGLFTPPRRQKASAPARFTQAETESACC